MAEKGVLERLQDVNPDAEIWWDSSPLVYGNWAASVVESAPEEKKVSWKEQLERLFNPDKPGETLFRGVTTNPPLSYNAIKDDPGTWAEIVRGMIRENPDKGVEDIFWMTYKQIVKRGAEYFMPVWEKSGHSYGYLSGQVDPRDVYDTERMFAQALELAELSPNVMIKCPGSRQGYELIERLTAMGIATNNTLAFTVPQFVSCMEAVQRGLEKAKADGVDLYRWRSVITHMSARYGTLGDLSTQAEARGIDLSEAEIRWAELAIFKRAYRIIEEKGYPNKMLMCSMRISPPTTDGSAASWHIEKIAGGNVIYTCPPKYIAQLMEVEDRMKPFNPQAIYEEPPREVLDKLLRLPYFVEAYEEDGMTKDQFNKQGALVATATEFSRATRATVDFVAQQFQAEGKM
ncbi:MAG: transaldolase [Deltaproteobacteria bacterium]|nr:transaldolase [Deltaproteobacteria bacterium]